MQFYSISHHAGLKREGTPGRHEPLLCRHAEMSMRNHQNVPVYNTVTFFSFFLYLADFLIIIFLECFVIIPSFMNVLCEILGLKHFPLILEEN